MEKKCLLNNMNIDMEDHKMSHQPYLRKSMVERQADAAADHRGGFGDAHTVK